MQLNLKPSHAKVREYFSALNQFGQLNISHETAVRQAFAGLLDSCARQLEKGPANARIYYQTVDEFWRKEAKYEFLDRQGYFYEQGWREVRADSKHTWLNELMQDDYEALLPLGDKEGTSCIFADFSLGMSTNRDDYVYGFINDEVLSRAKNFVSRYNVEVARFIASGRPKDIDGFVRIDELKWSRNLKRHLASCDTASLDPVNMRRVVYRPFTTQHLYLSDIVIDEPARTDDFFPSKAQANLMLCVTGPGSDKPFVTLAANAAVDLHLVSSGSTTQCFPFRTYSKDGISKRENITDWALDQFRSHYKDKSITKWDIFYYAYGVLHHPEYRSRYAANLKRELPRIPYAGVSSASELSRSDKERGRSADSARSPENEAFHAFAKAGKRLAELHVEYEKQHEYPLERKEKPGEKLDFRVEKMRLSKDKQTLVYNNFLTLTGIPPETYEYRLGNRSALEWVIDQYQVSTDKRSGITNDPNRQDDPEYILRLIGQVITVSLETVKIVKALPDLGLPKEEKQSKAALKTVQ